MITNYLITVTPESPGITIDITTAVFIGLGLGLTTYIISSILLRPIIVFKMISYGSDEEKSINYSTRGEINIYYRWIPFLIFKKVYTAKFINIDNPEEEYGEYTLPLDLPKLRISMEQTYIELQSITDMTDEYYDRALEVEEHLQSMNEIRADYPDEASWREAPEYSEYVRLNKYSRRLDIMLDDGLSKKADLLCHFRKKETVIMLYDPTYKRKPTYSWEFQE